MNYFVIDCTEDGEVFLYVFTKEGLENRLNSGFFNIKTIKKFLDPGNFFTLTETPGTFFIKGEGIQPTATKIETLWKVD